MAALLLQVSSALASATGAGTSTGAQHTLKLMSGRPDRIIKPTKLVLQIKNDGGS